MRLRKNEFHLSSTEWDRLIETMRCLPSVEAQKPIHQAERLRFMALN